MWRYNARNAMSITEAGPGPLLLVRSLKNLIIVEVDIIAIQTKAILCY